MTSILGALPYLLPFLVMGSLGGAAVLVQRWWDRHVLARVPSWVREAERRIERRRQ